MWINKNTFRELETELQTTRDREQALRSEVAALRDQIAMLQQSSAEHQQAAAGQLAVVERMSAFADAVRNGTLTGSSGTVPALFSAPACRGGMASRRTSGRVPAYRAATASTSRRTSGVSTGSAEITRSSQPSWPTWSVSERRSRTNASTSRPWNRTRTLTPGWTSSDCSSETR